MGGRLLRPLLAATLVVGLGLAGCGVSVDDQATPPALQGEPGPGSDPSPGAPAEPGGSGSGEPLSATGGAVFLHQAAAQTAEIRTVSTEMTMEMSGMPGVGAMTITTEGSMDLERARTHMTVDMGDVFGGLGDLGELEGSGIDLSGMSTMEMITDGDVAYIRSGMFSMLGIDGWVRTDVEGAGEATGTSGSNDPTAMLDFLKGAGDDFEELGQEEVRGVTTTHVRATLDLVDLMEQASPDERAELEAELDQIGGVEGSLRSIPAEAWVDADGFVRRYKMSFDLSDAGDPELAGTSMVVTVEMFDINEPVDISIPDPSEVTDLDATAMGMGMGNMFED